MTARARLLDYVLLAGGLWLAWILLFQWAGPEALSPPGATLRRVGEYLTSAQFWPHVAATGIAFAYACVIALVGGLALGFVLGANRLAGQVGEPILSSLYSIPKITLYPVILLVFGPEFPPGRVRRCMAFPGRALSPWRAQEYEPGADQDRARASPRAACDGSAPCCCRRRCRRSSPGCVSASATLLGTLIGEPLHPIRAWASC